MESILQAPWTINRILEKVGLRRPEPRPCEALDQLEACLVEIALLPPQERDRILRGLARAIAGESFSMSEALASRKPRAI